MDRLETREIVYFVAVAEELHFGRAAERLGIAQPPLSRAITRLERRLGVRLLDRTSRSVTLTPAGEVLLHEGASALTAVTAAAVRTRRAGEPEPRLVLAMKAGADAGLVPGILSAYEDEPKALPVEVLLTTAHERAAMLRDGRADVGLLHRPYNELRGLDSEDLISERQVVVLPRHHRLASRPEVQLADLEHEPMPRMNGVASKNGPDVRDAGQLMQLIALGQIVAVLPESIVGQLRNDLVGVPVADAPTTTLVIAWAEDSRSRAVAGFVRAATAVASASQEAPAAPP